MGAFQLHSEYIHSIEQPLVTAANQFLLLQLQLGPQLDTDCPFTVRYGVPFMLRVILLAGIIFLVSALLWEPLHTKIHRPKHRYWGNKIRNSVTSAAIVVVVANILLLLTAVLIYPSSCYGISMP